jgi:hypothetical protein
MRGCTNDYPDAEGRAKMDQLSKRKILKIHGNSANTLIAAGTRDPDLWIIELDIADGERLIGL